MILLGFKTKEGGVIHIPIDKIEEIEERKDGKVLINFTEIQESMEEVHEALGRASSNNSFDYYVHVEPIRENLEG